MDHFSFRGEMGIKARLTDHPCWETPAASGVPLIVCYIPLLLFLPITRGSGHTYCNKKVASASFQILKKALQGTLKWLLGALEPSISLADLQQHRQFLRGVNSMT